MMCIIIRQYLRTVWSLLNNTAERNQVLVIGAVSSITNFRLMARFSTCGGLLEAAGHCV